MLEKTRDSYNVDAIAQRLALAALCDREHAQANWRTVREDRRALAAGLQALGFEVADSETNFLLARAGTEQDRSAADLYEALRARDILVRYFPDLPDRLRITVGTPAHNKRLLGALASLVRA